MKNKKQAPIFSLFFFTCFPLVLLVGGLVLCYRVSGFDISKIHPKACFNEHWEIEPISEKQRLYLTNKVFAQPFYYLESSNYCYVFMSADRKYILRFFKNKALAPHSGLIPSALAFLNRLGFNVANNDQLLTEHIFTNYKNAYEMLRTESGLMFIHLNRSHEFNSTVRLIDVRGKTHLVTLDSVEFIVQRTGIPIFEHFAYLISTQQEARLRSAVRSFLQLIAIRCEKGFANRNLGLQDNFGFVENQPIHFECGTLTLDLSMKYPLNIRREILLATERLNRWAHDNYPDVTFLIQEEAQQVINQLF